MKNKRRAIKEIMFAGGPVRDVRELWGEIVDEIGSTRQWIQSKGAEQQEHRDNIIFPRYAKLKEESKLKMDGKTNVDIIKDLSEENGICPERIRQILKKGKKAEQKRIRGMRKQAKLTAGATGLPSRYQTTKR